MKHKTAVFLAVIASVLLIPGLALAHHGQASYNLKESVTVTGTVTDFQLLNPHSIVYLDVKGEKDDVQKWQGEMTSPNRLIRGGWNKKTLKPGDQITLTGWGSASGAHSLWITKCVLANGEELKLGAGD
jgi:Family of unknown function (DUF6152)